MRKALLLSMGVFLVVSLASAESIFDIARNGTPAQVRNALRDGARVDARDHDGETPLIYAAVANQDPGVISLLLAEGAGVDARDKDGNTALMGAARNNGNPDIVSALLKAGAAIEGKNTNGRTALMYAAGNNPSAAVMTKLLEAGAKIDAQDAQGDTALAYAAEGNQNPDIVTALLNAGADLAHKDRTGLTILMRAASYSQSPEVLAALVKAGARVDERDNLYNTALIYAAARNLNPSVIPALLKAGADIEARNNDGMTPLMIAGQYNQNPEIITLLVKAGALISDRDRGGETALLYAAANTTNPQVITALLNAGASIDEPDSFGRTALMVAALYTKVPAVIETLLKAGADTRRKDNQGRTAFECAGENTSLEGTKERWDLDFKHSLAPGLLIVQYRFYDIFPVFYSYYDTHPLGQVVIMNTLDKPVSGVKMSFFAREFMNAPRECPVPSTLLPNEPATADLFAVFQPGILQVTENMKVQAEVTLEYVENGQARKKVVPHTFSILKRNAVDWSDTRKAAAFASPSDPTVLRFAKNVIAASGSTVSGSPDPRLSIAMSMHEALTLYGLAYSQDPIPVFTANRNVADFIQFPRQTLENRGGKCSDLSVLYASLLEAVGVETAFVTTPAHIFLAVALTLDPQDARKVFGHPEDLIFKEGKTWLPLEVTLREGGFTAAWERGAQEWRENAARNEAALTPLHEAWKLYEPVALPGAEPEVKQPAAGDLVALVRREMARLVEREISERVTALQWQISRGGDASRPCNELGVLYARYGLWEKAGKQFEASAAHKESVATLINLGNICLLKGDVKRAVTFYRKASEKNPKNAVAFLDLARSCALAGDRSAAMRAWGTAKSLDADLAARFAFLESASATTTRASGSGEPGAVLWEEE